MKNKTALGFLAVGLTAITVATSVPQEGSSNKTPRSLRRKIVKEAEKIFRRRYAHKCGTGGWGAKGGGGGGMCPYWALAVIKAGAKYGKRLVLQAGSMQWRFVPPELDDGVSNTAFGYQWSPTDPKSRQAMAMGLLPEMHVWVADPKTQELIDLSTRDFKKIAENQFGLEWKTKDPPAYLWVSLEGGADSEYMALADPVYTVDEQATRLIHTLVQRGFLS